MGTTIKISEKLSIEYTVEKTEVGYFTHCTFYKVENGRTSIVREKNYCFDSMPSKHDIIKIIADEMGIISKK